MNQHSGLAARSFAFVLALALGSGAAASSAVQTNNPVHMPRAQHVSTARIRIDDAWVRAAPPGAMMLAGYMTLRNDGDQSLRLLSVESNAFGMVAAHRTLIENGISRMRPAGEIVIAAHQSLRFEPGGLHLMLMQERRELKVGDKVDFRLHFAGGSVLDVVAVVRTAEPAATAH